MNLDNLNKWLTLIANVGVLAGIVFLAFEIQQNRLSTEAQTRSNIANMVYEGLQSWADNPTLIQALVKLDNGEELSQEENVVLRYSQAGEMRRWENTYYQYERGLFSDSEFRGMREQWRARLATAAFDSYWDETRMERYSEGFVVLVQELIAEN